MKNKKINSRSAFTLTEVIVAMSLFTIGIVMTVGSFVRALRTQRVLTHLMSVNSNTSLVLEQIAREVRTGYDFSVTASGSSCALGGNELEFINAKGNTVIYKHSGEELLRAECSLEDCGAAVFSPITAGDVAVRKGCFLNGQDNTNNPWRITIMLDTGSSNSNLASNFIHLQTTVASRILPSDLEP